MKNEPTESIELCERDCANPAEPIHPCPFQSDVHNDDSDMCNCCSYHQNECCMEI